MRDHMPTTDEANTHRPVCVQPETVGVRQTDNPLAVDVAMSEGRVCGDEDAPPLASRLRAMVTDALEELGPDELRVMLFLAERLRGGKRVYGALDLATDRRDWRKERDEELADAIVYSACEALRRDLPRSG